MNERLKSSVLTCIFCVFPILRDSMDYGEDTSGVAFTKLYEREVKSLLCSGDKALIAGVPK